MWRTASIRILFLCPKRNGAKSTQNKHLLWTGLCFQCGLEPLNESRGQFPKRLGRTNTSSLTKDKRFWRGPRPSALTVNTRVSGTNVTCDWWGTSGIEGQEGNHRGTLWKEANSCTQTHKHAHWHVQCVHARAHMHMEQHANCPGSSQKISGAKSKHKRKLNRIYCRTVGNPSASCYIISMSNSALPVRSY